MYLDRHLRKTQIIWPERQRWQRYKSRNDWYRQAGLGHIKAYCELSYSSCLSVSRHNINLALNYVSWLYFVWAGDSSSTIGTVALSEWMDVPLLVSAGSCHWNQHRSWETIPLLVRTVICSYNLYVFFIQNETFMLLGSKAMYCVVCFHQRQTAEMIDYFRKQKVSFILRILLNHMIYL